jgi:hypothetical protein
MEAMCSYHKEGASPAQRPKKAMTAFLGAAGLLGGSLHPRLAQ